MTFKYRFIFSFVLLEIFFILLIVVTNFSAIKNSTNNLINQTVDSNVQLLKQLIRVPLSIKDIATLDNFFLNSDKLEYVNTIIVLDNENNILTTKYNFEHGNIEELLRLNGRKNISFGDEHFVLFKDDIYDEEVFLGSLYIIFDISKNKQIINENKTITYIIILIEILISTILSYIIGHKLTEMLTSLTEAARDIGQNKNPIIPYQNRKDEIGILAKSMFRMLKDLKNRNKKLKELGDQLRKQKNALIQANIHKDEFLANMSHELKTPLNSINVISSVMMKNKQGKLDDKQVKNLQIINSCGNDLLYLINDILDISKIEAGELVITKENIIVKDLFNEIYEMFEPQVISKGLKFELNVEDTLNTIISDSMRIKQIVKNLVNNSIKFTKDGGIYIDVKDNDDSIIIIVKDDGIGISSDKLPNIFDRFKQADGTINRKFGGTGLGLSITKELSKMLHGEIFVNSFEGVGTTFKVYLSKDISINSDEEIKDYKATVSRDLNTRKTQAETKQIEKTILEKTVDLKTNVKPLEIKTEKKILLLNQDPLSFMQFVIEMKKQSNLTQVSSLDEIKTKIKDDEFDLIIIDSSNFNIEEICNLLNNINSKIAIISNKQEHLDNPLVKDFDIQLSKPFDKILLKEEINKVLV